MFRSQIRNLPRTEAATRSQRTKTNQIAGALILRLTTFAKPFVLSLGAMLAVLPNVYAQGGSNQALGETTSGAAKQLPSTPGSDIESGGNSAALATAMGVGANAAASAFMFKTCAKSPATNQWACIMGAMSAAQAVMMAASTGKASKSQKAAACQGAGCLGSRGANNSNGPNGSGGPNIEVSDMQTDSFANADPYQHSVYDEKLNSLSAKAGEKAKATFDEFKKLGYSYDPSSASVTTPNGKISTSALSGGSMGGALSVSDKKEIESLNAAATKIVDDYKSKLRSELDEMVAYETSGGASAKSPSNHDSFFDRTKLRVPASRGQSLAVGLSKKFGQDNIGVAGDNIFKMISRRYDSQRQGGKFLLSP
ncbi:MAG: hypothetical protein COT74_10370 [Bdellovibrionales bacterium CG10_big_fil_rev_8_21_14_0_10_45_34]|nr:MAG: hypothetical protein COT74_10370 [Bdellovibrionales bacterium CG10_big_fil_rev_8_21_14_0_10_45_34]